MERMTRHTKDLGRNRGAALAEMAIVLVLLLLVTLGALEYGWLFVVMHRLTNAARQGARIEARLDAPTPVEVQDMMAGMLTGLPVAPTCSVTDAVGGGIVTATASVPTDSIRLIHWDMLPVPETLQATVQMAKEGTPPP